MFSPPFCPQNDLDMHPVHQGDKRYADSTSDVSMSYGYDGSSEDDEDKENITPSVPGAAAHTRTRSCLVNAATNQWTPINNADLKLQADTRTGLMDLPLEVRRMIYTYLTKDLYLVGGAEWEKDPEKNNGVSVTKLAKMSDDHLGYLAILLCGAMRPEMLRVSKSIKEEYGKDIHRDSILTLHLGDVVPNDLSGIKWNEWKVTMGVGEHCGNARVNRTTDQRELPASGTSFPGSALARGALRDVSNIKINIHWSAVVGFNTGWHHLSIHFLESTSLRDVKRRQMQLEWTPTKGKRSTYITI